MARTTTNYGFNISEGTDLVNPLTDIFPNFEDIDTDLKAVSDSSVTTATELKTGTVHALTRADGDRDIIRFTATANFTAGETFTVDGVQVTALTTAGEQLTSGCYIIGSEVLCALKGTLLTFYISQVVTDATTLEGHGASYFATADDLDTTDGNVSALSTKVGTAVLTTTAQDCSGAINEINANLYNFPDYANEITTGKTFNNYTLTFTATVPCVVMGSVYAYNSNTTGKVNNHTVFQQLGTSGNTQQYPLNITLNTGDTLEITGMGANTDYTHIYPLIKG